MAGGDAKIDLAIRAQERDVLPEVGNSGKEEMDDSDGDNDESDVGVVDVAVGSGLEIGDEGTNLDSDILRIRAAASRDCRDCRR